MSRDKIRSIINFLGVNIDVVDTDELCNRVVDFASRDSTHTIMYVNTDCMLISQKNEPYRHALNSADLVYADGVGVVYGVRFWGHSLPGRSTAADFMPGFCRTFSEKGIRLYFIGASEGVAAMAAERLKEEVPNLLITGTHHGYFKPEEEEKVISAINAARPDIVIVGLGAPYQELWINKNADKLNAAVVWGVGGLFDFLSGRTPRGPQWLLDNGFEWLCRLIVEPRRLWQRYLIGNTKFVLYLFWRRFIAKKPAST